MTRSTEYSHSLLGLFVISILNFTFSWGWSDIQFMLKLKNSGYNEKFRKEILDSGLNLNWMKGFSPVQAKQCFFKMYMYYCKDLWYIEDYDWWKCWRRNQSNNSSSWHLAINKKSDNYQLWKDFSFQHIFSWWVGFFLPSAANKLLMSIKAGIIRHWVQIIATLNFTFLDLEIMEFSTSVWTPVSNI
jgi:hypothetical protein